MKLSTKIIATTENASHSLKKYQKIIKEIPTFKHEMDIYQTIGKNRATFFQELLDLTISNCSIPEEALKNQKTSQFEGDQSEKCIILYGISYQQADWQKLLENNCYQFQSIQVRKFQGKTQEREFLYKKKSQKTIQNFQKLHNSSKIHEFDEMNKLIGQMFDEQTNKCSQIYKIEVIISESIHKKYHFYYLPQIQKDHNSSQIIKKEYFTTKFLQILQQYVSLDSKTSTLYKDSAHTQFESLIYSGVISSFLFFIYIGPSLDNELKFNKIIEFLNKVSELSLTDKHLLEQIDSLSLIEYKKQLRKLCVEESRLKRSLSVQKNQLAKQIFYLIELLDLKSSYPDKIKFSEIDISMLKKIRAQNVEKKTNWIKDQSFVCRNLDIRIKDLYKTKQQYLKKEINQKVMQTDQIQNIRNQIRKLDKSLKEQLQRKNSYNMLNRNIKTKKSPKNTTQLNEDQEQYIKNKSNTSKIQIMQECQNLNSERIMELQKLKAEFQFQKQFQNRKKLYTRASQELIHYLTDC